VPPKPAGREAREDHAKDAKEFKKFFEVGLFRVLRESFAPFA